MCNCKNVNFGTFGQPNQNRTAVMTCLGKMQEIDNCILDELKHLWEYHIITLASCCGHNKVNGSIIVDESSVEVMKQLGYVESREFNKYTSQEILNMNTDERNKFHEEGKGWFYPKSIPITNKFNETRI